MQHFTASITLNRFETERPSLLAMAINADNVVLTSITNDGEEIYDKQMRALGQAGDILLVIYTRGNSNDIVKAVEAAVTTRYEIIALTGYDGSKFAGLLGQFDR